MEPSALIGTIGVTFLLTAYFLNLRNIIASKSLTYIMLNFFGAALACISSIMIQFYPFVVLEGIWALVSITLLFKLNKKP